MFSKLLGLGQNAKVAAEQVAEAPPVVRVPMPELVVERTAKNETKQFSCLEDLFGDMIENQHSSSLNRWEKVIS